MKVLITLAILAITCSELASSHSCPSCSEVPCSPPENCQWGTNRGLCLCCDVCSKGPGDRCGGPWNVMYGFCGEGYVCVKNVSDDPYYSDFHADGICTMSNEVTRRKRRVGKPRRAGLSQIQAQQHFRRAYGGVPEHIKQMLRARGVDI